MFKGQSALSLQERRRRAGCRASLQHGALCPQTQPVPPPPADTSHRTARAAAQRAGDSPGRFKYELERPPGSARASPPRRLPIGRRSPSFAYWARPTPWRSGRERARLSRAGRTVGGVAAPWDQGPEWDRAWWLVPVIPASERLRQEDCCEFQLGLHTNVENKTTYVWCVCACVFVCMSPCPCVNIHTHIFNKINGGSLGRPAPSQNIRLLTLDPFAFYEKERKFSRTREQMLRVAPSG